VLNIWLDTTLISSVAEASNVNINCINIQNHFAVRDAQVHHIGLALKGELEAGGMNGSLYGHSLASALAIHLLRRYASAATSVTSHPRGLPQKDLRGAIAFIHDHLAEDLTLARIANELSISPSHFAYQFKASTGYAPHQYIIQARVEQAKRLLLEGGMTIGQVAASVGFFDQSHLTRHMRRLLNTTPRLLARKHEYH
jgi:AraC family transcriptional regulator